MQRLAANSQVFKLLCITKNKVTMLVTFTVHDHSAGRYVIIARIHFQDCLDLIDGLID